MTTRIQHIITMLLTAFLALQSTAGNDLERIVVISDPHLLAPGLVTPGSAIDRADASEMKMMAMSDNIMTALTDSIIAIKPALVLMTGDLTHNGERMSHDRMAWHLDRMAAHGIQTLVIPGNHDCNNPYACRYDGDATHPTATITREEFAQIYHRYGYGDKSRRDPSSLSYCCEPVKDLVVIGIDSNMDELNTLTSRGDSADTYYNAGRIKPETLQWVIDQATQARKRGKRVIAMTHHHLVPHFDRQDRFLPSYIVQDHESVAWQLMQAGIHTIFTGHLHVTDAATLHNADGTDSIVEVSTGSAICYPFALRVGSLDRKHRNLNISTRWLDAAPGCSTLRELGRQRIINATPGMAAMLSGKAWTMMGPRMDQFKRMLEMGGGAAHLPEDSHQATQLALRHLKEVLSRTMLAIVEGNEGSKDVEDIIGQGKQGIRAMIAEVAPGLADNLWDFFENDVWPRLEPMVRGILEDRNAVGTHNESVTNDLSLKVTL